MLAVLDQLQTPSFDVAALAPPTGRLAEALRQRGMRHVPIQLRDDQGTRLLRDQACRSLADALSRWPADLVHSNSLAMGRLTGVLASQIGVPCITHLRDIIKLSKAAIADLNGNQLLLAVSRATKDFHVAQGIAEERTRVLYNGVDCRRFRPRLPTGFLHRELNLPRRCLLAATIGQIALRKGQDVLADAAVSAAARLPHVHYLLIGERYSQKEESIAFEQNVVQRFEDAGLRSRLHCLGYRDDVPQLMNEIGLLIHPAHQEPLGRVLLEAAASGLPIIATQVGGTAEIVQNGLSARLVPPADSASLAEAIVEFCEDAEKRQQFAAAARARAERAFPIDRAATGLAAIWQSLTGRADVRTAE